jgi:hypothetical protein
MWNKPTDKQLSKLPPLYSTENIKAEDKTIRMHFFYGSSDWYAAEYSPEKGLFFGLAIIGGDKLNAEWGYFSLQELCAFRERGFEIDRDLHWKPCPMKNAEKRA